MYLNQHLQIGKKYNLTTYQKKVLAYVAWREQRSIEGAKIELSQMANYTESKWSKYDNVYDFVTKSEWYGHTFKTISDSSYINLVDEILVNGVRYLPKDVIEHDCIDDIKSISTGNKNNRNNYIPGKTVIKNIYGATYVFVGFAPNGGDPFGYLK